MKRACLLSLLLLASLAAVLPLVDPASERSAEAAGWNSQTGHHMSARRYRAWLRHRRAVRRRRALALARSRERRRRAIIAARRTAPTMPVAGADNRAPFTMNASSTANEARMLFASSTPDGWRRDAVGINGEIRFSVRDTGGATTGAAFFAPLSMQSLGAVSAARPAAGSFVAARNQMGGVSFATLRRSVIDKMIEQRGWVANDLERTIGGRRVFVVIAQTGDQQAWTYYFTEMNGQLYSLAVKAALTEAAAVAAQSERFIASLRSNNQPAIAAETIR